MRPHFFAHGCDCKPTMLSALHLLEITMENIFVLCITTQCFLVEDFLKGLVLLKETLCSTTQELRI